MRGCGGGACTAAEGAPSLEAGRAVHLLLLCVGW